MRLEQEQRKLAEDPYNKSQQEYVNYFRQTVRGNRYRGENKKSLADKTWDEQAYNDKENIYRVSSSEYYHYYIGHYSPEKYQKEMIDYKNGNRKSRPNGRSWCKLRSSNYQIEYVDGTRYIRLIYNSR